MSSLLVILIGTVLVNTFLLMQSDEALGGTRQGGGIASAIRIGGATAVVLAISAVAASLMWRLFAMFPIDALLFVFAAVVVTVAFSSERIAGTRFPRFARALASSPLMVVSNSLALGVGLLGVMGSDTLITLLSVSVLAVSFVATLAVFAALTARISLPQVPTPFRTAPVILVSAGLLALALLGFTGILRS